MKHLSLIKLLNKFNVYSLFRRFSFHYHDKNKFIQEVVLEEYKGIAIFKHDEEKP